MERATYPWRGAPRALEPPRRWGCSCRRRRARASRRAPPASTISSRSSVGAGSPTTFAEGTARCGNGVIDPILSGEVRSGEMQLTIGSFSGWDAAWDVPGTVSGYHEGLVLWVPTSSIVGGEPFRPLNTPRSPSLARYWPDPDFGCHDGVPSGTVTFTATGPWGGRIAGSFSDVVVAPSDGAPCGPHLQAGVSAVVLSGSFDVTRSRWRPRRSRRPKMARPPSGGAGSRSSSTCRRRSRSLARRSTRPYRARRERSPCSWTR